MRTLHVGGFSAERLAEGNDMASANTVLAVNT
jgi:hypothetical protein